MFYFDSIWCHSITFGIKMLYAENLEFDFSRWNMGPRNSLGAIGSEISAQLHGSLPSSYHVENQDF